MPGSITSTVDVLIHLTLLMRTCISYSWVSDEVPKVQRVREPALGHMLGSRVEWMGEHQWANG